MGSWIDDEIRAREEQIIRETLAGFERPADVRDIQIEFGEDHSGYPAVWVWLIVPKSLPLQGPEWRAVYDYCEEVGTALVQKRLTHWPYVNLRNRSRAAA